MMLQSLCGEASDVGHTHAGLFHLNAVSFTEQLPRLLLRLLPPCPFLAALRLFLRCSTPHLYVMNNSINIFPISHTYFLVPAFPFLLL